MMVSYAHWMDAGAVLFPIGRCGAIDDNAAHDGSRQTVVLLRDPCALALTFHRR
jgi:hypothetical protein